MKNFISIIVYILTLYLSCISQEIKTSNPNAIKEAKCILKYLDSLSKKPNKKIISGQMTNNGINPSIAFDSSIAKLQNITGKWVGIVGSDYERDYPQKLYKMNETNQPLIKYYKQNGLVTLMWSANNPWTGGVQNDLKNSNNLLDLINSGTAANKVWISYLDSLSKGLKELQDSGVVVLWRPLHEMNGNWFWWGSKSSTLPIASDYIAIWKHMYNYFTIDKGLNNLLWVYSAAAKSKKVSNPAFKDELFYYPGDEFVDIIGVDIYSDTLDVLNYQSLLSRKKPLVISEFGPDRNTVLNKTIAFDYMSLLNQIKKNYPNFVYWMSWNDFITNGGKDSVNYSMLKQKNSTQLLNDSWVVNKGELDWFNSCNNSNTLPDNGPWKSPIKISFSSDGVNFDSEKIFQDSSGVPCVIKWKGDTLACVFQWFRQPVNSNSWDRVAVKFSYDNGKNWTEPTPIIVNGLPSTYQRPFDPTLTTVENNKLRIYYSSSDFTNQGQETAINTYSAISSDGVNYEFEPNTRYDHPSQRLIDPAVIYYKNEWHYLSPKGAPQDGAFHCTSTDGLNFTKKDDYTSDNIHNWTGNFTVENKNELRFYGSGANIWLNKSNDATTWNSYINTNVKGGDPSVVKISDDNYIMICVGVPYNNIIPPVKVTLISPKDQSEITAISQVLIWQKVLPNIINYQLQISLDNQFSRLSVNDSLLKDTTFNFKDLKYDSVYFWRVRAKNSAGWGQWSFVRSFKVKSTPNFINENISLISCCIFPNPANNYIELTSDLGFGKIEIYNPLGIKIIETEYQSKLDVSKLTTGIYFLKFNDKLIKFVKM